MKTHTVKVDLPTLESVEEVIRVTHTPWLTADTYALPAELVKEIGLLLWDYDSLRSVLRTAIEGKAS